MRVESHSAVTYICQKKSPYWVIFPWTWRWRPCIQGAKCIVHTLTYTITHNTRTWHTWMHTQRQAGTHTHTHTHTHKHTHINTHTENWSADTCWWARLRRFMEAAKHPETQLTYTALTGQCKHSIADVERLFSPSLAKWMKSQGYDYEANYVQTIHDWRRAVDERGLFQLERSAFNQKWVTALAPRHVTRLQHS